MALNAEVEDTDSLVYLGAIVSNSGGAEQDIRSRLGKARSIFHQLSKVQKQVNSAEKHCCPVVWMRDMEND